MGSIIDSMKKMLAEHKRLNDQMQKDLNPEGGTPLPRVLDTQRPKPRRRRKKQTTP